MATPKIGSRYTYESASGRYYTKVLYMLGQSTMIDELDGDQSDVRLSTLILNVDKELGDFVNGGPELKTYGLNRTSLGRMIYGFK